MGVTFFALLRVHRTIRNSKFEGHPLGDGLHCLRIKKSPEIFQDLI